MLIKKTLANLEKLKAKIPQWAKEAILERSDEIVNIVKYKQLSKGISSLNVEIGRYSPNTERYAARDNISTPKTPGMPYNFYWSGDTMENMYLKSVNKEDGTYDISTLPAKKKLLEDKYGEIFQLTETHNTWVNENIIEPYVALKIDENLFDI